ncbi:acyltransferase [Enterobacterales bacterium CwR94]|nr:acyltransferase [Enterobacterales bacterium CwR94]
MKQDQKQIHGLTIFRFVSAFYVFIFHCNIHFNVYEEIPLWAYMVLRNGAIGMTFFFVLSGFVMSWAHRFEVGDNYFKKRFLRIYPAYLAMGVLTIPFLNGFNPGKLLSVLGLFLTGTQSWYSQAFSIWNFTGSWSVSTEIFFYAVFPFIYDIIKKHPLVSLFLSYIATSSIIPISLALDGKDMMPSYYMGPMHRIPEFIFGMSLGFIFSNGIKVKRKTLSLLFIFISAYFLSTYVTVLNRSYMLNNYMTVPTTGMIIFCLASLNISKNALTSPFIYLGKISYSFYLMYIPLIMYVKQYKDYFSELSNFESWIVIFILNFILAVLSYEFIEKKFAYKKKMNEVRV